MPVAIFIHVDFYGVLAFLQIFHRYENVFVVQAVDLAAGVGILVQSIYLFAVVVVHASVCIIDVLVTGRIKVEVDVFVVFKNELDVQRARLAFNELNGGLLVLSHCSRSGNDAADNDRDVGVEAFRETDVEVAEGGEGVAVTVPAETCTSS